MLNQVSKLTLSAAVTLATASLLISAPVQAAGKLSQNQVVTDCKEMAIADYAAEVSNVKLTKIKNRRGVYTVKMRVSGANERSMYECKMSADAEPQLVRLDTASSKVAAN